MRRTELAWQSVFPVSPLFWLSLQSFVHYSIALLHYVLMRINFNIAWFPSVLLAYNFWKTRIICRRKLQKKTSTETWPVDSDCNALVVVWFGVKRDQYVNSGISYTLFWHITLFTKRRTSTVRSRHTGVSSLSSSRHSVPWPTPILYSI